MTRLGPAAQTGFLLVTCLLAGCQQQATEPPIAEGAPSDHAARQGSDPLVAELPGANPAFAPADSAEPTGDSNAVTSETSSTPASASEENSRAADKTSVVKSDPVGEEPPRVSRFQFAESRNSTSKVKNITFDTIAFEIKKDGTFKRSLLTDDIEDLDGRQINVRGFILPGFQQKGITRFVLVRDNKECCFGPGAALYDCIVVQLDEGRSTSFTVRPVTVEGIFKIDEFKGPDGKTLAIYHVKQGDVK